MRYHGLKMAEINKIIKEYWINTYKGNGKVACSRFVYQYALALCISMRQHIVYQYEVTYNRGI